MKKLLPLYLIGIGLSIGSVSAQQRIIAKCLCDPTPEQEAKRLQEFQNRMAKESAMYEIAQMKYAQTEQAANNSKVQDGIIGKVGDYIIVYDEGALNGRNAYKLVSIHLDSDGWITYTVMEKSGNILKPGRRSLQSFNNGIIAPENLKNFLLW